MIKLSLIKLFFFKCLDSWRLRRLEFGWLGIVLTWRSQKCVLRCYLRHAGSSSCPETPTKTYTSEGQNPTLVYNVKTSWLMFWIWNWPQLTHVEITKNKHLNILVTVKRYRQFKFDYNVKDIYWYCPRSSVLKTGQVLSSALAIRWSANAGLNSKNCSENEHGNGSVGKHVAFESVSCFASQVWVSVSYYFL